MRCRAALVAHLTVVTGVGLVTTAEAQLTPPPPMQSGGLAPPPPGSGPTPPPPPQPSMTQQQLEQSQDQDSGRGLEFVYFQLDGGLEFAGLTAIHQSGSLLADTSNSSALAPFFGVASGMRLLYFTVGPSFRFAHASDWDLWTLNLDFGWHIPLGKLEPYGFIGGGYARVGHAADNLLGADRGVSIAGFDVRLGFGFDYYLSNVFSVGAMVNVEVLRLGRSGIALNATDSAAATAFGSDASSLGITATGGAVVGFHF
jgi:hypothetical protein